MTGDERRRAAIVATERQILALGADHARVSAATVERLRAMLDLHAAEVRRARAGDAALRAAAERSVEVVAGHLGAGICPVALARFGVMLPISDDLGDPRRGPDEAAAADYADLIAALSAWETAIGPDARLRAAIQHRLSGIVRTCRARVESRLRRPTTEDFPDIRLLARDILRIEAVEWAVGIAGGAGPAEELRLLAHHAARQAVQWAGAVFERFRAGPDEFSHFDAVATLSAVDDLLVVILRVMESDRDDRRSGSHPFVLTLGEQALQDFVRGFAHMTRRYLDIGEQHLLGTGAAGAFLLSVLQVLQRILRLGQALVSTVTLSEVRDDFEVAVYRVTTMREQLRRALGRPGAPPDCQVRLAAVEAALSAIGPTIGPAAGET